MWGLDQIILVWFSQVSHLSMSLIRFAISSSTRWIALGSSSTVIFSYAVFLIFAINRGNSFRSTSTLVLTRWFCSRYSSPARCATNNTFWRCSNSWYVCRLWRWRCWRLAAALFNWCVSWTVRSLFRVKLSFNSWSICTNFASRSPLLIIMHKGEEGGAEGTVSQSDSQSISINQSINQSDRQSIDINMNQSISTNESSVPVHISA